MRIAILGSTRGSSMLPVIEAIQQKRLSAEIKIVISNKSEALILSRAAEHGLATAYIDPTGLTREAYDQQVTNKLREHQIDYVLLIGYMRILSCEFVAQWQNRILNIHPSLLPDFAGGMDLAVHQAVLDAGVNETGCTVHIVTEEVDAGPIVTQKRCEVLPHDTAESLKQRVQALEGDALVDALSLCSLAYARDLF